MFLDRDELVAGALAEALQNAKIGVVAKGISGIRPLQIASRLSTSTQDLHVAIVGYPSGGAYPDSVTVSTNIEDAVSWRSTPDLAGRIVVFVADDAPKLHSLGDLDTLGERDIAKYLIKRAEQELFENEPQKRFWRALSEVSATFPLELIEQFVDAVHANRSRVDAIPTNLWRLGLLRDYQVLDHKKDPKQRLIRNRELLVEMALLSEQSRKRIAMVLANAQEPQRSRLREAFAHLNAFYRRRSKESLQQLDLETVEELIRAGKPLPKKASRPDHDSSDTDAGTSGTEPSAPLRGKKLAEAIAECVSEFTDDSESGLRELAEALRRKLANPEEGPTTAEIGPGFGGRTIALELPPTDLTALFSGACSEGRWGGVLRTSRSTLKDALLHASLADLKSYSPTDPGQGLLGQCLFALLRNFDQYVGDTVFSDAIDKLTRAREELIAHTDLLLSYPFVVLGGNREVRKALDEYLSAYEMLLRGLRQHEGRLHERDAEALRYVMTELLRLDVIYVRTPSEWKAVLTPLHPFHLWKYREILREVSSEDRDLTEEERKQLAQALPNLPHLVHFLVVTPQVTGGQPVILPQAGTIESLPTFENHTNRYLGADGIELLPDILKRFLIANPFARPQLRLGLVDVPDLKATLTLLAQFFEESKCLQILADVYFTRGQNANTDLGQLDFEDRDHELAQLLRAGQIVTRAHSCKSVEEAVSELQKRPVHVAVFFDQAQYHIGQAPRARKLLVSPLVVTYHYEFSETFHKGTISPSSEADEGIFSDYHFVIERAALLPAGQQLRLQHDQTADLRPINGLLSSKAASWLVIADRDLTPYSPDSAVPLGERRVGQREIGVWAPPSSRTVGQLVELLRRYNLRPNVTIVAQLIQRFGHIAAGGMLSLPGQGTPSQTRERQEKAFMGTVLAAAWYRARYPDSLIASLDSNLARIWLGSRTESGQRADLIGLRVDHDGAIVIESIEVKTHADGAEVRIERTELGLTLVGRAIDQLRATIDALEPIFANEDHQSLFVPAKREVLKYQLYRECFRDVHDPMWKRDWYHRLQSVFARPCTISIRFAGLVIHVQPEENTSRPEVQDSVSPLRLVTLGAQEVQALLSSQSLESAVPEPHVNRAHAADGGESAGVTEPSATRTAAEHDSEYGSHTVNQDGNTPPPPLTGDPHAPYAVEVSDSANSSNRNLEIEDLVRSFRRACQSYRIQVADCDPNQAVVGPSVIRLYVKLARGQRLDPLREVLPDIGREMQRTGLIVTVLPHTDLIALDVPRLDRERVPLTRALQTIPSINSPEEMPIPIGVTPEGEDVIRDLGAMPHMLVGGTTGAGKTRFLWGVLLGLLRTHPEPKQLRLFLSSSKPEDFSFFDGLPHLEGGRVIYDADEAIEVLTKHVTQILDERGPFLTQHHCTKIQDYNRKYPDNPLPPLVVVVDEFADLVDQLGRQRNAREEFYKNIRRVAQLGRSRGIHLVLCTQRPSADLVPTNIRNLMNVRVALRVNDVTASRMILEAPGAEQLQFHGDLLLKEHDRLVRAQGYTIEPEELIEELQRISPIR